MNPCGNKWNLKSTSWLNPKCNISGCSSVSKHRMPSCADAVHSRCGHGRGRNAFLPGEVTIHPGRHHTKPLQKDLKEHHVDTRQGAWCQKDKLPVPACVKAVPQRLCTGAWAPPALEPFLQFQSGKQCLQFKELDLVVHIYMSYFLK